MTLPSTKKTLQQTRVFRCWFDAMLSRTTKSIIASRVERLQAGLYGDVKPCGAGVSELRIDVGPGYRVYFTEALDNTLVLLLIGGNKATQQKDIVAAKELLANMKQQRHKLTQHSASVPEDRAFITRQRN